MSSSLSLEPGSRIAIVGTGIAGLAAAHRLHPHHRLTLFEAGPYVGGHTNTIDVEHEGRSHAVDTGFIVFNQQTYPGFCALLEELGVASKPSEMSFSVRCAGEGLEYSGASLRHFFAQRRNLLRPSHWWMLREILRFFARAPRLLETAEDGMLLGDYLREEGYGRRFREQFILPMGAAIWSAPLQQIARYPARRFIRFFVNHGMLELRDRPLWRVVEGGSRSYVEALTRPFRAQIRTSCPVQAVRRGAAGAQVTLSDGTTESYDALILATHSDQALRLLEDPSRAEVEVLGSIPYQRNEAVLHTDTSLLPRRRKLWSAWNYHLGEDPQAAVGVTYNMNILQGLAADQTFCVTLNQTAAIDPDKVLRRITYHHPIFSLDGVQAQQRYAEVCGPRNTWFCGAWWGYGFHEDGLQSGYRVASSILGQRQAARVGA